jgi:hypothetical protein
MAGAKGGGGMKFKTESGSVYEVDTDKMTWRRESTTDRSGTIRNEHGDLLFAPDIVIGEPCELQDTSVLPGHGLHFVVTSRVTEIL